MQLNSDQKKAVEHDGNCLVVACPGSGKTRLLVSKVGRLLRTTPHAKIILVSFTRDSVIELRHRIAAELGGTVPKNCVISTFHSLALLQIRRHQKPTHAHPRIVTGAEQFSYILRAYKKHCDPMAIDLSRAEAIIDQARSSLDYIIDTATIEGRLVQEYVTLLRRNNVIDMNDILLEVVSGLFLGEVEPFSADYMMIDEFQDTDEIQFQWMLCHHAQGTKVTVVGDDDQSIYRFRKALGYSGMTRFVAETGADTIALSVNYRCREEIVRAADQIIRPNQGRIAKQLIAFRGQGGSVSIASYATRQDEAVSVVRTIAAKLTDLKIATPVYGQFCVLARNNHLLDEVEGALGVRGIPYCRSGGKSLWESYPLCIYLSFLAGLDRNDRRSIDQFLAWIIGSPADLDELNRQAGKRLPALLQGKVTLERKAFSEDAWEKLQTFARHAPTWKAAACSGDEAQHNHAIATSAEWAAANASVKKALAVLSIGASALQKMRGSPMERARAIQRMLSNAKSEKKEGVFLTTMHGSKGLEFDYVWIISANAGIVPSEKEQGQQEEEEERRLFYVAATRAKNELSISSSEVPSKFLCELREG